MPMVKVTMLKGALTPEQKDVLTDRLTHVLLMIEGGTDNPAGRAIAWTLYEEIDPKDWAIGGKFDGTYEAPGGRFLFSVTVPEASLSPERRPLIIEAVNTALMETLDLQPDDMAGKSAWVHIHEIPEGHWGAGGEVFGVEKIFHLWGVKDDGQRMKYIRSYLDAKERAKADHFFPGSDFSKSMHVPW